MVAQGHAGYKWEVPKARDAWHCLLATWALPAPDMDGNGWGTLSLPIREVCTRWIATAMRTSDFQNDTISHSFTLKVILRCRNCTGGNAWEFLTGESLSPAGVWADDSGRSNPCGWRQADKWVKVHWGRMKARETLYCIVHIIITWVISYCSSVTMIPIFRALF